MTKVDVLTQLTLFYLWFYKVQFCNFRRLITWRSQLGPPIQVLYRVTLFIRIYKSLSRREAGYGSETLDRRQDTGDRREETIMTICIVNFDSVTTFIQ